MDLARRYATVTGLLKSALKRKNVRYRAVAQRLAAMGVHDSERNIANKISRGGFTAVFFIQWLGAIGVLSLRLNDWANTPPLQHNPLRHLF